MGQHRQKSALCARLGILLIFGTVGCVINFAWPSRRFTLACTGGLVPQVERSIWRLRHGSREIRLTPCAAQSSSSESASIKNRQGDLEKNVSTLSEQWGLLGLVVGLAGALYLGFSDVMDAASTMEVLENSLRSITGEELEEAAEVGEVSAEIVGTALEGVASRAAFSGLVGAAAGSVAGILVEEASEKPTGNLGSGYIEPGEFTSGTIGRNSTTPLNDAELRQAFANFDVNGDASIATDELVGVLSSIGRPCAPEDVSKMIAELDTNRDGSVDLEEFLAIARSLEELDSIDGMRKASEYRGSERPMPAIRLGFENFRQEWAQLLRAAVSTVPVGRRGPAFVDRLVLSNEAVIQRERCRTEVPTPPPVRFAYDILCAFIDVVFENRPIQRFWFLETVARMPYFAYSSALFLYETIGWWRSPELRAVHLAEEDNELHHLLIMESLGGDQRWFDRFLGQHSAIAYYWILLGFFVVDPRWSYNFSRLIEAHAVDTYGEFVDANKDLLRRLPPPPVAVQYYRTGVLYLFDKFQTSFRSATAQQPSQSTEAAAAAASATPQQRRPPCSTLYDVFCNIRDDEEQHVLTMEACEAWVDGGPAPVTLGYNVLRDETYRKEVLEDEARNAWREWAREVAQQQPQSSPADP